MISPIFKDTDNSIFVGIWIFTLHISGRNKQIDDKRGAVFFAVRWM
jgi:hypothetical protein